MISHGQVLKVPYYIDKDNDYRWTAHNYEFAFRPSGSNRKPTVARTQSGPPVDLNRPMGTGLRRPSTQSEYGL